MGSRSFNYIVKNVDIVKDIFKYRVYEDGIFIGEYISVEYLWRDDFVSFLIGCSFFFELELLEVGISIRYIEENCNVFMFKINIECEFVGIFNGKMVVSMRFILYD